MCVYKPKLQMSHTLYLCTAIYSPEMRIFVITLVTIST